MINFDIISRLKFTSTDVENINHETIKFLYKNRNTYLMLLESNIYLLPRIDSISLFVKNTGSGNNQQSYFKNIYPDLYQSSLFITNMLIRLIKCNRHENLRIMNFKKIYSILNIPKFDSVYMFDNNYYNLIEHISIQCEFVEKLYNNLIQTYFDKFKQNIFNEMYLDTVNFSIRDIQTNSSYANHSGIVYSIICYTNKIFILTNNILFKIISIFDTFSDDFNK